MNINSTHRRLGALLLACCCVGGGPASAQSAVSRGVDVVVQGVTQPSLRTELAFSFQGIITKVNVKEGDSVGKQQELMRQDEVMDVAKLEGLKLDADQSIIVKAKQANLDKLKLVLTRKQDSYKKGATTITELQEAQNDVVQAEAEVEQANHIGLQKMTEVQQQTRHVELLTLKSPIDGIVEKVAQTAGETADMQKPSIIVVQNDPLYIDIKTLRTAVVQRMKKGDTLAVRYPGEEDWKPATINFIAPVADARADTQAIRLEMPNADGRSTGLSIDVKIPTPTVADAGFRP